MRKIFGVSIFCLSALFCQAKVVLPHLFSNGMVLQQKSEVPVWGTSDVKNARVRITTSWNLRTYTGKAGVDGKFNIKVKTPAYGGPYTLTITDGKGSVTVSDVMIGEVWLCSGQSNMDMRVSGRYGDGVYGALDAVMTSGNYNVRMFNAAVIFSGKPLDNVVGSWQQASTETTGEFSATAFFFARKLNEVLHVPVGIVHASCGGSKVEAWMSEESVAPYKGLKDVQNPSCLFNGMMNAIVGYGIRGCLWYQGEANVDSPELYTRLFPTMVSDWRQRWGEGKFPFYYAQIAPYNYRRKEGVGRNTAYMREAQGKCLGLIPRSGMICLSDIGQSQTIHPMEKETVGNRFACLALHDTYGMTALPSSGPTYKGMKIDGGKVEVFFDNIGKGLTTYRMPFTDFEIAGKDRVFHNAMVKYGKDAKSLILSSKQVPEPVAVRYGFKDYFKGCLYNMMGLPASSFRSDDWPIKENGSADYAKVIYELQGAPSSIPGEVSKKFALTVYRPKKANGKAVIICPGGGYDHLAINKEGHDMAQWMASMGITWCVLEYRLPHQHWDVPLSDAEQAVRFVRKNAGQWGVDSTKVGIMGCSAGGHLAASLATLYSDKSLRPDFQILLYPVISMDKSITNKGTHDQLIGEHPSKKLIKHFSLERQVDKNAPKAFIALSADDKGVNPKNSQLYKKALENHNVPVEMHVYPTGGHGWGFSDSFRYKQQWTEALAAWLAKL